MIRSFEKIQKLGVFDDFKKPASMEDFQKFNLIYGSNGSGKTTLSRFFFDLNTGVAPGFPELKYKIKSDSAEFKNGQSYARSIAVFNSEFIHNNIGQIEGSLNPIYILGEDNKTLAEILEADEKLLENVQNEIAAKNRKLDDLRKQRGKIFTDIAKTVSKDISGALTRTYNKTSAERAFEKLSLFEKLEPGKLSELTEGLKQNPRDLLNKVQLGNDKFFQTIEGFKDKFDGILKQSATAIAIAKLVQNPDLLAWVEQGQEIHLEETLCQYCLREIPEERKDRLAAHFNAEDATLKTEIENLQEDINELSVSLDELNFPSRKKFYIESVNHYVEIRELLRSEKENLHSFLGKIRELLGEKLLRRNEGYELDFEWPQSLDLKGHLESMNSLIETTNAKTQDYEKFLIDASSKVEAHHLASVAEQISGYDDEILEFTDQIESLENGLDGKLGLEALRARIEENRGKLSDAHRGADELSKKLFTFLGRNDLKFVAEDQGYRIERYGRPAQKLSEGERTAIAFLYFVVSLNDKSIILTDSIVVIDDPISSLDSSSIYQAFSFLKNAVKDAHQIFILTHNFSFLKLLLNWLKNGAKNSEVTYWMLACKDCAVKRETLIVPLDKVLKKASSEYQYLFKILRDFDSDGSISSSYHIPNVCRKVLETYLEMHFSGKSLYKKLEKVPFDEQKKVALNKYANDLSHSTFSVIDPALVGETEKGVKTILEMIELVTPLHFQSLVENTS